MSDTQGEFTNRLHTDPRLFTLNDGAWNQFLARLDRPVMHKPRLAELFAEPSIFDAKARLRADAFPTGDPKTRRIVNTEGTLPRG
jgi:hypothetical protein